jgi:hypothetical protein
MLALAKKERLVIFLQLLIAASFLILSACEDSQGPEDEEQSSGSEVECTDGENCSESSSDNISNQISSSSEHPLSIEEIIPDILGGNEIPENSEIEFHISGNYQYIDGNEVHFDGDFSYLGPDSAEVICRIDEVLSSEFVSRNFCIGSSCYPPVVDSVSFMMLSNSLLEADGLGGITENGYHFAYDFYPSGDNEVQEIHTFKCTEGKSSKMHPFSLGIRYNSGSEQASDILMDASKSLINLDEKSSLNYAIAAPEGEYQIRASWIQNDLDWNFHFESNESNEIIVLNEDDVFEINLTFEAEGSGHQILLLEVENDEGEKKGLLIDLFKGLW